MNNVGTAIIKPTEKVTAEDYAIVMSTNLESTYHLSQLAHPLLKASGFGSIIFMSSVAGVVAVNVGSLYSTTKGINFLINFFVWSNLYPCIGNNPGHSIKITIITELCNK